MLFKRARQNFSYQLRPARGKMSVFRKEQLFSFFQFLINNLMQV